MATYCFWNRKDSISSLIFACGVLGMLALILSTRVVAQDDTSINSLAELSLEELLNYEVTAPTKVGVSLSDAPGSVSVITYNQIRNSSAQTIPELLRLIPGIHVRWNPMVQSIEIRSFGSNPFSSRVLLLIDGNPYNSWNKGGFPQHPGTDFFNLENVKHIEIIRGAGSALYGENAFNGVLNIVTLSGEEYQQTRGSIILGEDNMHSGSFIHGRNLGEDGSLFFSLRSERTKVPIAFWDESDTRGEDLFIKAKFKDLHLSWYRRQDDFDGFSDPIVPPDFNFTSVDSISQQIDILAANYSKEAKDKRWKFQSNASLASRDGTACGGCHAASQSPDFSREIDHGYQAFANAQLELNTFEKHRLLFGLEYRKISAGEGFDQVPHAPEDNVVLGYRKAALFVQDSVSFLDNKLNLIAGVRYDFESSPDLYDDALSPRLNLIYKPQDALTFRFGWNEATRSPSLTEYYENVRFFGAENPQGNFAFPPTFFLPNFDLVSEEIESLELGMEYIFSRKLSGRLDTYYNKVDHPIILSYGPGFLRFENHPNQAIVKGIETELRYEPSADLSAFINWSYQNNSQRGSGVDSAGLPIEFTYSPKHKVNLGLTYDITPSLKTTLEVSWRDEFVGPLFWNRIVFNENDYVTQDNYAYVNMNLRYRLPFKLGRKQPPLTLSILGKNLGDEKQAETVIGVPNQARGREFFININYELPR